MPDLAAATRPPDQHHHPHERPRTLRARRNPHDFGTVGIVIGADRIDPDNLDVDHLDDLLGRLLQMIALNRSGRAIAVMTLYTVHADQLGCSLEQLRTARHTLADTGHGTASYDTLAITTWPLASTWEVRSQQNQRFTNHSAITRVSLRPQ